ncbi:MAG: hypothetical protein J6N21_09635 [Butyrivibrio sp.]|nr:hypothetical protein [Butyrivibrio sp.]
MSFVFAKVNSKNEPIVKLLTCEDLYSRELVDFYEDYSADTALENDQWFRLSGFSKMGYRNHFIDTPVDSTYPMGKVDADKIEYICVAQSARDLYFQRVTKSKMITKSRFISLSGDATIKEEKHAIVLSDRPDAIYLGKEDTLYFKDIARIAPIFKGIDNLFREATEEEVSDFLSQQFIKLGDDYGFSKVGKRNRKHISKAIAILSRLSVNEQAQIFEYTSEYSGIEYINGKFLIVDENDLKKLLYGIDQRYYTTPIGNERRIANSIISLQV